MVFNYVKIAIRNILRNKTNSIINIVGLAVGMACVILIGLFLNYEWSYDAFHANKDRIYRMVRSIEYVDMGIFYGTGYSSIPLGPTMQQEFPEVVDFVRTSSLEYIVQHGENSFYESVTFADPSLFTMFSFPLIAGNPTTALSDLHNIVITEEMAEK